jgi:excisionase family DNA binding protein
LARNESSERVGAHVFDNRRTAVHFGYFAYFGYCGCGRSRIFSVLGRELEEMTQTVLEREFVEPTAKEELLVRQFEPALRKGKARLVAPGRRLPPLPGALYEVLKRAVHLLAQGHAVAIVPYGKMLTTQQAAELLNVSRPYLVKLVESGEIPHVRVGSHRRIRFAHLMEYRGKRDAERRKGLDRMAQFSQKIGLYDKDISLSDKD